MTALLANPPRTVAVIGASPRRFFARWTIVNMLANRYGGRILLVHPTETELLGLRVHPSVDALGEVPDLAFVALGAPSCAAAVRNLAAIGCPAVVVLSDGFAETATPEGAALQAELAASAAGTIMIGPNCMGVADVSAGLVAVAGPVAADITRGPVSVISQSGGLLATLLSGLAAEGIGADLGVSVGNGATFSLADGLASCVDRPGTDVVAAYVEGVGTDTTPLESALSALAANGRRVVALIPGRSPVGRRLVESHTARVAGPHALVVSLFERHGAIVVPDIETLVRVAALSPVIGRRRGGVAVVTGSGGGASLLGDTAHLEAMPLADYGPDTLRALRQMIPASGAAGNPLDMSGGLTDSSVVMATVAADPSVAALVIPFTAPFPDDTDEREGHRRYIQAAIDAASAQGKALVVTSVVEQHLPAWSRALRALPGVGITQNVTVTARALGLLLRPGGTTTAATGEAPATEAPATAHGGHVMADPRFYSEADGRALFESVGLGVVPGRLCGPTDDPVAVAEEVGFPLIAKAVLPGIAHKAAVGGVSGPLLDAAVTVEACRHMAERCTEAGLHPEGFLFEQIARGPELLVGLRRDPVYGPFMVLGLGGYLAEAGIAGATTLLGSPGDRAFEDLVERAHIGSVVDASGLRHQLAAYLGTLASTFVWGSFAGFVTVEVNPLFLSPDLGVVAADVLIERSVSAHAQG